MRRPVHPSRLGRPGKVLILLAVSITSLIGVVAIAVDGGMLMDNRRKVQAAADAAAMSAAIDMYEKYNSYAGKDESGSAEDSAFAVASAQGYKNGEGSASTVTVNIPPKFGNHVGKDGYVEVIIEYRQPRYFAKVFGLAPVPVKGRAVARGLLTTFNAGILVLDLDEPEALKANGGGTVHVKNSDIIVNSNADDSVGSDGLGSVLAVDDGQFVLSGGIKANTTLQGDVLFEQRPTPDPLAHLPYPPLPSTALTASQLNTNSLIASTYLTLLGLLPKDVGRMYVLEPGRYDRMPVLTATDVVILKQASANDKNGVYYLNDSGFSSTGATIVMDPTGSTTGGVTFFNDPVKVSSTISITGGKVVLSPPTSGPYKGITIFQRRDSDAPVAITGTGALAITGTFYAAGAPIKITGSSSAGLDVIGSQYISRTLQSGGVGSYSVDWQADQTAPLRQVGLVE